MYRSQLLFLLKKLTTRERSRWRELVFSDFWNKNELLRQLCTYILTYSPHFDHPDLAKERAYALLYGAEPYQELRINNLISDLHQLLLDSLALDAFRHDHNSRQHILLEALFEREITEEAERSLKRWTRIQQADQTRSAAYYLEDFRRLTALDNLSLTRTRRSYGDYLQPKHDALDYYYHIEKLRIACDMYSRSHVVKGDYQANFLQETLDHCRNQHWPGAGLPAVRIYLAVYDLLSGLASEQPLDQSLEAAQASLSIHQGIFSVDERYTLYSYLLNYCVRQINSGQTQYYRATLTIYQDMLTQGVLIRRGRLSQWAYTNIITTGIRLQEYEWTADFIDHYRAYLAPDDQHNVYNYNLANLHFEQGRYHDALGQLQNIVFTDAFYHLAAKLIQLKIYYESNETEALLSLLEATRIFIQRNKQLSEYQQTSNLHFLRVLQKLHQLREEKNTYAPKSWPSRCQALLLMINSSQPLANKNWLSQTLNKLIKS